MPKLASYTVTYHIPLIVSAAIVQMKCRQPATTAVITARWLESSAATNITTTVTMPAGRATTRSDVATTNAPIVDVVRHDSATPSQSATHPAMAAAISRPLGLETDERNSTPGVAAASSGAIERLRRRSIAMANARSALAATAALARAARTPASLGPTSVPMPAGTNPSAG